MPDGSQIDESASLQVLGLVGDHYVGGVGEHACVHKSLVDATFAANIILAKKFKLIIAVPLVNQPPEFVSIRAGGANKPEETELNKIHIDAAKSLGTFRGFATDGIQKEGETLLRLITDAYCKLGSDPSTRMPVGLLDCDHMSKSLLGCLQSGGTPQPRHGNGFANPFLLFTTSCPTRIARRVDFASSAIPREAADPKFMRELMKLTQADVAPQPLDEFQNEVYNLAFWLTGTRTIAYAIQCRATSLSHTQRCRLLFFGAFLLTSFEIPSLTLGNIIKML